MSETLASLGSLITAIERYERLLTMNMSELETQYIEMRLSEKRLALALFRSGGLRATEGNHVAVQDEALIGFADLGILRPHE
jgi:hypothetical protein